MGGEGKNMGKQLDRLSRGGRLKLIVPPGRNRPKSAGIAAMFATECAVAVQTQMPIYPHWKD